MKPTKIQIGKRYGGWKVLARVWEHQFASHNRHVRVLCLSCRKTERVYAVSEIVAERRACCKSCSRKTHGMTGSRTYRAWANMLRRVGVGGVPARWYEGVSLCRRWRTFKHFLKDMGPCPPGCTIGRLKSHLGYCQSNCAWQTVAQQARCSPNNYWVTVSGFRFILTDLASIVGINQDKMRSRLSRHSPLQAFVRPIRMEALSPSQCGHRAMSTCRCCGRQRPSSEFYLCRDHYGRVHYSWICKACVRPTLHRFHHKYYGKGQGIRKGKAV